MTTKNPKLLSIANKLKMLPNPIQKIQKIKIVIREIIVEKFLQESKEK
jgi:hypothetical protein